MTVIIVVGVVTVLATLVVSVATLAVVSGVAVICSGTALNWLLKCKDAVDPSGAVEFPFNISPAVTVCYPKPPLVRYLK